MKQMSMEGGGGRKGGKPENRHLTTENKLRVWEAGSLRIDTEDSVNISQYPDQGKSYAESSI